ncbi:MAG: M1 family aminopeptidase, partial [Bacteroidota bacterium]
VPNQGPAGRRLVGMIFKEGYDFTSHLNRAALYDDVVLESVAQAGIGADTLLVDPDKDDPELTLLIRLFRRQHIDVAFSLYINRFPSDPVRFTRRLLELSRLPLALGQKKISLSPGIMIDTFGWVDGFAKYGEALYTEAKYGTAAYHRFMASQASDSKSALGSIYQRDTSVVRQLFDFRLVYQKGAVVLHMLRHVLGDSVFFRAMRSYVNDPRFRFNVATTEGFRNVCETVSGQQLGYFFNQWVYGEKYPRYTFSWSTRPSSGGHEVAIKIKQTTGTTNPSFFMMPIDFKLSTTDWDTTVVLFNVVNEQEFVLYVSHKPTIVALDPDGWILHDDESNSSSLPTRFVLEQNYPNPFNTTTRIKFSIPPVGTRQAVSLRVYNILGQEVAVLVNEKLDPGIYETAFDASGLASGVYFYRLHAGDFLETKKFILLR